MIDRKELAEEIVLRENVRKAIKLVMGKRNTTKLHEKKEEEQLRAFIRSLIAEGNAVASVAKHDSTGINALEDLLKNTNILSVLETGYKSLTTDLQQRVSYKNHILNAVKNSLAPEESRKEAGEDAEITEEIDEEIDIAISDRPQDDPDFISVDDEEVEEVEVDDRDEFGLEGEDKTGRNRAFTDFGDIEKVILTAFDDLDDPTDVAMFEEYLMKNLALYFEKFEGELQVTVPEPAEAAAAVADSKDDGVDDVTDMPAFELQEVLNLLDIDDIIEHLL
tara:strand:+ start:381 stop:1214 length:834 start_codon:yes stop_codon:yes gene_type:complete